MPPKKKPVDLELAEAAWAAGVFSSSGSIKLVVVGNSRVARYIVTSSLLPEGITRLAKFIGVNAIQLNQSNASKPSFRVSVQGAALHSFMTRVWDYITIERKQQYADIRKQISTTTEGPNPYRDDKKIEEYQGEED